MDRRPVHHLLIQLLTILDTTNQMVVCAEIVNGYYARRINARQCISLRPCAQSDPTATWIQKKKSKASFVPPNTGNAINPGKSDGFSALTPPKSKISASTPTKPHRSSGRIYFFPISQPWPVISEIPPPPPPVTPMDPCFFSLLHVHNFFSLSIILVFSIFLASHSDLDSKYTTGIIQTITPLNVTEKWLDILFYFLCPPPAIMVRSNGVQTSAPNDPPLKRLAEQRARKVAEQKRNWYTKISFISPAERVMLCYLCRKGGPSG